MNKIYQKFWVFYNTASFLYNRLILHCTTRFQFHNVFPGHPCLHYWRLILRKYWHVSKFSIRLVKNEFSWSTQSLQELSNHLFPDRSSNLARLVRQDSKFKADPATEMSTGETAKLLSCPTFPSICTDFCGLFFTGQPFTLLYPACHILLAPVDLKCKQLHQKAEARFPQAQNSYASINSNNRG